MPRTPRTFLSVPVIAVLLALGLTACSGDDDPGAESTADTLPEANASGAEKSCQAIVGSGAVEDIQAVFDQYKNTTTPFSEADEKTMRDALDRLAKAGDNAAPKIRADVVTLVADMGSVIDSRRGLPGVGKVADVQTIQEEIDALCR